MLFERDAARKDINGIVRAAARQLNSGMVMSYNHKTSTYERTLQEFQIDVGKERCRMIFSNGCNSSCMKSAQAK